MDREKYVFHVHIDSKSYLIGFFAKFSKKTVIVINNGPELSIAHEQVDIFTDDADPIEDVDELEDAPRIFSTRLRFPCIFSNETIVKLTDKSFNKCSSIKIIFKSEADHEEFHKAFELFKKQDEKLLLNTLPHTYFKNLKTPKPLVKREEEESSQPEPSTTPIKRPPSQNDSIQVSPTSISKKAKRENIAPKMTYNTLNSRSVSPGNVRAEFKSERMKWQGIQNSLSENKKPTELPTIELIDRKNIGRVNPFISQPKKNNPYPIAEGLINLGNTCYISAVLQALSSLPTFVEDMCSLTIWNEKIKTLSLEDRADIHLYQSLASILRKITAKRNKSDGIQNLEPIDPKPFKLAMGNYASIFFGYEQQDAHELLLDTLDCLDAELLKLSKKTHMDPMMLNYNVVDISNENSKSSAVVDELEIEEDESSNDNNKGHTDDPSSAIHHLLPSHRSFQSTLENQILCVECGYSRNVKEDYKVYTVPLPATFSEITLQLDAMIVTLFQEETIHLRCEKCKTSESATIKRSVSSLPKVLVLHVNRFGQIEVSDNQKKLFKRHDKICAPLNLDMIQFTSNDSKTLLEENQKNCNKIKGGLQIQDSSDAKVKTSAFVSVDSVDSISNRKQADEVDDYRRIGKRPIYKLRSIIFHHGNSKNSGHYTTGVMMKDGTWNVCDDVNIRTNIKSSDIFNNHSLQKEGFIYFYCLE